VTPYISGMLKAEMRWKITRTRRKRAEHIGVVKAADREFGITDPDDRKRLAALRDDRA
jgi:hypothetical protein